MRCCNKKTLKQYSNGLFCSNCLTEHVKTKMNYKLVFLFLLLFISKSFGIALLSKTIYTHVPNNSDVIKSYEANPLIIEIIESNGNHKAVSFKNAIGIMQVTQICLDDYNHKFKTKYVLNDMFNVNLNRKVSKWYLEKRIPELLLSNNLKVSLANVLVCYNAGISNCIIYNKTNKLPEETKNYLIKYINEL